MIKYSRRFLVPRFFIHTDFMRLKEDQLHQEQLKKFTIALNKAASIQKTIDIKTQSAFRIQHPALFTSGTPAKAILATYLQQREYQNEDLVGQTVMLLGEALQARGQRTYFDYSDYKDTLGFDVLMKDLSFVSDYRALAKVIRGFALLGITDRDDIIQRAFLLLQPTDSNVLDELKFKELLQDVFLVEHTEPVDNLLYEIEQLIKETQKDIFTAMEAIVTIRNLYSNLVTMSQEEEFISVNANIKMLEFEEALVANGLLSPAEIESEDISLSLETAASYITGNNLDMLKFISTVLKIQLQRPSGTIPTQEKTPDFGDLMLAVSQLKGKAIATKLQESSSLLANSNKITLARAFANAGLYEQSKQYLIEANEDSLVSLQTAVAIGYVDQIYSFQNNLTTLTLDELIALGTYFALQSQKKQDIFTELKDRLSNLNTIYDLSSIQQERIQSLEAYSKQKFLPLEYEISHSEYYNVIKPTLPKLVVLIENYDTSLQNELNGYAKLRTLKYPYMTVQDFLGLDKEKFKQKIMKAFDIKTDDIQLFNNIKQRLEELKVETSEVELNPKTIFDIQLTYLKKKALKCLNTQDDFHRLQLKQSLIDIEQRASILKLKYSFNDLISQIKTVPINFPKWFGMIPSQTIFDAKESLEGFKVSLLKNNIFENMETYCQDEDLLKRLQINGMISDLASIPNHKKNRKQQIIPSFPLAWKEKANENQQDLTQLQAFLEKDQRDYNPDLSDFFVVNLLNFKAELKTKKLPEIVDTVFNLNIWDKLLEERTSEQQFSKPAGLFINRDPQVLLKSLLTPAKNTITTSYLKTKLKQNEALNDLIKMRQELLQKLADDIANKTVSKETAHQVQEKINSILTEKINEIKGELRREHSSLYFRQKTNYIDVLFTEKDIEKLEFQKSNDSYLDADLLHGLNKLVNIKRSRAEEKLLTYFLMFKQMKGEKLSSKELAFLETLDIYHPNVRVTQLLVKDLTFPEFTHSNLSELGQFSASDVLFQLSKLFDDQLFIDIMNKQFWRKQGIQYQMRSRDSLLLLQQQEKQVWIDQYRLNDQEIKDIKEMLKLNRVSDSEVESLNQTDFPLQNVYSWIYAKSQEKLDISLLDRLNNQLWQNIFKCSYESTTAVQLHQVVELLLERFYILQYHPVDNLRELLQMILIHKNLSPLDKQNLTCYRKIVQFNSEDILSQCKGDQKIETPSYLSEMCFSYGEKLNI